MVARSALDRHQFFPVASGCWCRFGGCTASGSTAVQIADSVDDRKTHALPLSINARVRRARRRRRRRDDCWSVSVSSRHRSYL